MSPQNHCVKIMGNEFASFIDSLDNKHTVITALTVNRLLKQFSIIKQRLTPTLQFLLVSKASEHRGKKRKGREKKESTDRSQSFGSFA